MLGINIAAMLISIPLIRRLSYRWSRPIQNMNMEIKDIRKNGGLSNTSLTILETLDGGKTFKPVVWNETSYLGRKLSKTDSL